MLVPGRLRRTSIYVEVRSVTARFLLGWMAASVLVAGALAPVASAVPPANDNYLQAVRINSPGTALPSGDQQFQHITDTTDATVQSDVFAPQASGGGAENTLCQSRPYGKTVWYVFYPDNFGTAHFLTAGGLDSVVSLYEIDPATSQIQRLLVCGNDPGLSDEVFFNGVQRGAGYAVQLGGLDTGSGAEAGRLQLTFEFFPDSDQDGTFDALDRCRSLAGTVRSLTVNAPKGSHASLSCRKRCKISQGRNARARAAKTLSFSKLRGRFLPAGASIVIRVTRSGFFGDYVRFDIKPGNFKRIDRCLYPGSKKPRKNCP
jgi:hypothetical protein